MALIEVQNAHKDYQLGETEIKALRGVDISIDAGEFVAVWGPSGSGKSTLCNLIGCIDRPTKGSVYFNGTDLTKLSDNEQSAMRNELIGFIFQSFNLVPVLSATENVMLPLQIQGVANSDARKRAREMLDLVGLSRFAEHWPQKLSGGQRQRVAIARALVTQPKLVVADEPTANLDSENAMRIVELMREMDRSSGATFIFSTHDERLLKHVDRKVHLMDGLITEDVQLERQDGNVVEVPNPVSKPTQHNKRKGKSRRGRSKRAKG